MKLFYFHYLIKLILFSIFNLSPWYRRFVKKFNGGDIILDLFPSILKKSSSPFVETNSVIFVGSHLR